MQEITVIALSGGADSTYLLYCFKESPGSLLLAHFNHGARGKESDEERKFVEEVSRSLGLPLEVGEAGTSPALSRNESIDAPKRLAGFERKAREARYRFLRETKQKHGAKRILLGHTADDQVETILMRFLEGAGIAGLKGIPKETDDGIERPMLATWRKDVLAYLHGHGIAYREDRSNRDTRIERNWIRHVLIPLLEERYGETVKKRIFTLGERFRELHVYVELTAIKWLKKQGIRILNEKVAKPPISTRDGKKNRGETGKEGKRPRKNRMAVTGAPPDDVRISRKAYIGLPSVIRVKILQVLCFDRIGMSPNERLLASMDRMIVSGGVSARLNIGKGATLRCRYGDAIVSFPEPGRKSGKASAQSGEPATEGKCRIGKEGEIRTRKGLRMKEPVIRMNGPGRYRWNEKKPAEKGNGAGRPRFFLWEESAKAVRKRIRRLSRGDLWVAFDGEEVAPPLSVRPLRMGDRIRPFGLDTEKKVKEILIDRKVPREQRWGRPVVCDSNDVILWIPGVVRSAHAPVTRQTKRMIVLRTDIAEVPPTEDGLHREPSMLN